MNKFNTPELITKIREGFTLDIEAIKEKKEFAGFEETRPVLAIVTIGDDPASEVYVNGKKKECEEQGVLCYHTRISDSTFSDGPAMCLWILNYIHSLECNPTIDGILVQLPIVSNLLTEGEKKHIAECVSAEKDVDGFSNENLGKVMATRNPKILPCTVQGVMQIIDHHYGITDSDYTGKKVIVIGRSKIVGMPLVNHLIMNNATVININTKNNDRIIELSKGADIFVVATGRHGSLTSHVVQYCAKEDSDVLVVDVGINRVDGKLKGDFLIEPCPLNVPAVNITYTPVPGGVGRMTVLNVIGNLIKLCKIKYCLG